MLFCRLWVCSVALMYLVACSLPAQEKDNKDTVAIYLQLGERYLQLNKLAIARENLQHALMLDNQNAQIYHALGVLNEKLRLIDAATVNYQQAFALTPNDLRIQNNYGRFLCEQGDTQQGITLLIQATTNELNERPWFAMTNLGRCYLQLSNNIDAERYFMQALQIHADYSPALLEMQKINYIKGDIANAKAYLARYQRVAQDTAESLLMAIKIENAAGNSAIAEHDRQLLLSQFPLSQEAKTLKSR